MHPLPSLTLQQWVSKCLREEQTTESGEAHVFFLNS